MTRTPFYKWVWNLIFPKNFKNSEKMKINFLYFLGIGLIKSELICDYGEACGDQLCKDDICE